MVARGDRGVEISLEEIPSIQKTLIHKGYNAGLQVITATQMLDSMAAVAQHHRRQHQPRSGAFQKPELPLHPLSLIHIWRFYAVCALLCGGGCALVGAAPTLGCICLLYTSRCV